MNKQFEAEKMPLTVGGKVTRAIASDASDEEIEAALAEIQNLTQK